MYATCYLLIGTQNSQSITWSWKLNGNTLTADSRISFTSANDNSKITITESTPSDTGNYECVATNAYGSGSRTTTLNSKNRLTPVWPFLGIIGEAAIVAGILVTYELVAKKNPSIKDRPDDEDDDEEEED